jgi:hypothetical protein
VVSAVWRDGDEVGRNDTELMTVDREDESGVGRTIDQSQEILDSLRSVRRDSSDCSNTKYTF